MQVKPDFPVLVIVLSLTCLSGCKKDKIPDSLPPITQAGKNTFGCKLNGQVWVPYAKCNTTGSPCEEVFVQVYPVTNNDLPVQLEIKVEHYNSPNTFTEFHIFTTLRDSIYSTGNKTDSLSLEYYDGSGFIPYTNYNNLNNSSANQLQITKIDTVQKILSGTFEGVLYKSPTDSVTVSEGRFDVRFEACSCTN
jgi:hypothetical protein